MGGKIFQVWPNFTAFCPLVGPLGNQAPPQIDYKNWWGRWFLLLFYWYGNNEAHSEETMEGLRTKFLIQCGLNILPTFLYTNLPARPLLWRAFAWDTHCASRVARLMSAWKSFTLILPQSITNTTSSMVMLKEKEVTCNIVKPHLSGPHLSRLFTYPDICFRTNSHF